MKQPRYTVDNVSSTVVINGYDLSLPLLEQLSHGNTGLRPGLTAVLAESALIAAEESRAMLERLLAEGAEIYGVTSGFGENCATAVASQAAVELQRKLVAYHGVGCGAPLSVEETRAVVLTRLNTLARGYSGVRPLLLEHMLDLIQADVLPVIPEIGSVGASGDLTPLSYLAALVSGDREACWQGRRMPAADALVGAGIEPLELREKEGLAIMNGTAVMTGIAALAVQSLGRCFGLAERLAAGAVEVSGGDRRAFDPDAHSLKPHPGQQSSAERMYRYLSVSDDPAARSNDPVAAAHQLTTTGLEPQHRVQDVYSLRCAPQLIGAAVDTLSETVRVLTVELNSSNDNPLFDPVNNKVYNTGHFQGSHVALASDALRNAAALVADLLDKQCLLLLDGARSGLPPNLAPPQDSSTENDVSGHGAPAAAPNHGLKALGITVSALAAEIDSLSAPIASRSRPTESMNQDVVSLGQLSARRVREVARLFELMCAAVSIVVAQAAALRAVGTTGKEPSPALEQLCLWVRASVPALQDDRALDTELQELASRVAEWPSITG
ncbi:MAG: histidine ammonia-lyase [Spirochaetia bacterium]